MCAEAGRAIAVIVTLCRRAAASRRHQSASLCPRVSRAWKICGNAYVCGDIILEWGNWMQTDAEG
jgi:hypothetical protein